MTRAAPLAALAALAVVAGPAAAADPTVDARFPRSHGWWIGDILPVEATVEIDADRALDPASLPRPRAVTYWLDLRDVRVDDLGSRDGRRHYRLAFDYQTFYAPLEPKALTIPPVALRLAGEDGGTVTVPPFTFVSAPLREIMAPTVLEALAPLRPIAVVDTRPAQWGAGLGGLTALAALVGLAWHRAIGPFSRRPARPFSRAARAMRPHLARGGAEDLRAAHLALHRAFDAALGRRMIAADVDGFLAARPDLAAAGDDVRRFFEGSGRLFFGRAGSGTGQEAPALAAAALGGLARRLAALERSRP